MAEPHTDDELRERFRSAFGRPDDAAGALASLRPGMVRARRRHRVRAGATTTVASLLMATGVGAMVSGGADPADPRPNVATSPAEPVVITAPAAPAQPNATATPSTATDSTTTIASPTSAAITAAAGTDRPPSVDPATAPSTSAKPATTPTDSFPTPPPPAPASSVAPPPSTTEAPTSTAAVDPTAFTLESPCGSVVVAVDGNDVNLVSVHPAAQMLPDVKNNGPEKVEVSFEGAGGHCELEAEVHDGQLVTEIDNE